MSPEVLNGTARRGEKAASIAEERTTLQNSPDENVQMEEQGGDEGTVDLEMDSMSDENMRDEARQKGSGRIDALEAQRLSENLVESPASVQPANTAGSSEETAANSINNTIPDADGEATPANGSPMDLSSLLPQRKRRPSSLAEPNVTAVSEMPQRPSSTYIRSSAEENSAKMFRPHPPQRTKTVSGFSTVTPSRPTMAGFMGKPRRPSSAPNVNGSSPRSRSKSEPFSANALPPNGRSASVGTSRKGSEPVTPDSASSPLAANRRPSTQSIDSVSSTPTQGDATEDESYFVLARLEEEKEVTTEEVEKEETKKGWFSPAAYLQASFQAVKESMLGEGRIPEENETETDWEFWGKVMNDYETTVRKHPRTFTRKLHQGIPDSLRGMVWQLICKGKDPDLENQYATLITRTSIHEKVIQRDLARTFPKHERFQEPGGPGQESLFNIIKAYSLYDPEIGYCQGIAFVVGALLLNMPDEEAFCVLVRLMKDYKLRELYTPQMVGLQLRLYQYDELLEEQFPAVAKHLEEQEVKSTMYASQWFMTMFAYRFPLSAVFRIMDVIFAEGVDAMLRFAIALIKRNQDIILTLDFENLLEFLKNGLFDVYADNVVALIYDAASIRISKSRLDKLAAEHAEAVRMASPEHMEADALRAEMRRMMETIKRMETEYEILNREHVTLANRLLEATVSSERDRERADTLQTRVAELEARAADERKMAEQAVQADMERLAHKNLELTARNAELQEEVIGLQDVVAETKLKWADCENQRSELQRKWDGLKKVLG
ncbi:hypothetical protein SpCBS45565_g07692 [Spizellomyces sp. 'palustris']|nr:hypothetical protein SpCBS45565_g07692 [Spizellomyces sp. 'palustris']